MFYFVNGRVTILPFLEVKGFFIYIFFHILSIMVLIEMLCIKSTSGINIGFGEYS